MVYKLTTIQMAKFDEAQLPIYTEHVIHGGMYVRTITLPPHAWIIGALVKIPTLVTVIGAAEVTFGEEIVEVKGYAILPASANRKQFFKTGASPVIISMAFPTKAKTVEEAEKEFTDEAELLLSRRQDLNAAVITGE